MAKKQPAADAADKKQPAADVVIEDGLVSDGNGAVEAVEEVAKASKKAVHHPDLIKISKTGEPELHIHKDALAEHEKLGWKRAE